MVVNKKAPQIPGAAFERARKGIEAGEATYADRRVCARSRDLVDGGGMGPTE